MLYIINPKMKKQSSQYQITATFICNKMENSCTYRRKILFKFIHGYYLLWQITCLEFAISNEDDRLALLDLKNRITEDPLRIMSSWNDSGDLCIWPGVTCNQSNKRVIILNLQAQRLVGSLPPSIGNLTYLTAINLTDNNFNGEIPQEMGRLQHLQYLNLSWNSFGGNIPSNISHCTKLKMIDLGTNKLIGSIPKQLSSLLNLTYLWVGRNNFTGAIPAWIGNFSSLDYISLRENNFEGSIPDELGRLTSLGRLVLTGNKLSGVLPSSVFNVSSIYYIVFTQNHLHGELPKDVGITLPNLEVFAGGVNNFTGSIPVSLSNASRLEILDFAQNALTGKLPAENLGTLKSLSRLNFEDNRLGSGQTGDLNSLAFLANCTSLEVLSFSYNRFGGELPESIANLSTKLRSFSMGGNLIHGSIPSGIANLVNLYKLEMEQNYLDGSVPDAIGKLQKLQGLNLNLNQFSGLIPSSLGNLTSLTSLNMQGNRFVGSIPPSLGDCQNLLALNLSSNQLSGRIPKEVMGLSSLSVYLSMSNNSLTGSLPSEVGELVSLSELDVSGNKLSGEIPTTLGSCTSLVRLHLEGNEFEGAIPLSLGDLSGLEEIDISRNKLSGQIPEFLAKFISLNLLNISHNDFEGKLPEEGIFTKASGVSLIGNDRLCGGISQFLLPACPSIKLRLSQRLFSRRVIIPTACAVTFMIALCSIAIYSRVKKSRSGPQTSRSYNNWKSGVSYSELLEWTNGFSMENLVGSGSFGSVYKGVHSSDGTKVAVKVLNLQQHGASKSFIDECKVLRSIRHRNLLQIITACSSIDNQGNDFKSLVFEFMENGSLDAWLHPREEAHSQIKRLSITERLNLSIEVASALDYLHHHCETPIVHCDLKPSNVLLDEDMVVHVGDFGLARFLLEPSDNSSTNETMSAGLKGSIGYIPPEYGMGGQVSVLGDVYSYGILLLEVFTGKRPTDDMFKDGLSIHQFTAMALPDHVMDIVEPSLLLETDKEDDEDDDDFGNGIQERPIARSKVHDPYKAKRLEECLDSVMKIGVCCSSPSPSERMHMGVVVNKMTAIRESYHKSTR